MSHPDRGHGRPERSGSVRPRVLGEVDASEPLLDVYWRPGCVSCRRLRVALAEAKVDARWHNIHADADAARFVRDAADGNETVPTVAFDGTVHVNPRPKALVHSLQDAHPERDLGTYRIATPLRIVQWVGIITLIVIGEMVASNGREALSWAFDGAAVVWYFAISRLRSSTRSSPRA